MSYQSRTEQRARYYADFATKVAQEMNLKKWQIMLRCYVSTLIAVLSFTQGTATIGIIGISIVSVFDLSAAFKAYRKVQAEQRAEIVREDN